ncbi:MAG TPA: hypothetical protein VNI52_12960 [Sphingobacteriaceae bacterium]|nr:hypothetical protein [Sphingobacteriaceae bacterium]
MKRLAVILLLTLYTISVMGVGITKFYCCGKLTSTSLLNNSNFSKAEKKSKAGCCETTRASFKVKDSHMASSGKSIDVNVFDLPPIVISYLLPPPPLIKESVVAFDSQAPPGSDGSPIYILNCTYRI